MAARAKTVEPAEIVIRMYNVGFGDCFLVSFRYASPFPSGRQFRHMLVDFGSTERPKAGPTSKEVAEHIHATTGGIVDVVVATHRHKDHVSGFGTTATDAVMSQFAPARVIRPWTDDPTAPRDATRPHRLDSASRDFLRVLDIRESWLTELASTRNDTALSGTRRKAQSEVDDQLPNQRAIDRLNAWSANGRGIYVSAGDKVNIEAAIPGLAVDILGPPTLKQVPGLASEAFNHDEFWLAGQTKLIAPIQSNKKLREAYRQLAGPGGRGEARWILSRLARGEIDMLFNVVRAFDHALNNTSVIMLLRARSRTILLSGDAQIENWTHCLKLLEGSSKSAGNLRAELAEIDLYKVGHHGSRNATPQSMYALWEKVGQRSPSKMVTLLSTLPDKHGETPDTYVPKQALVDALRKISTLYRSDDLAADQPCREVRASTKGQSGFESATP